MYRYSQKIFNDSLAAMGVIRVGTLHDFRRSEHKQGISDPNEGTKSVSHEVNLFARNTEDAFKHHGKDIEALDKFGVAKIDKDMQLNNFVMGNCKVTKGFNEPDCFILSSTFHKSNKMYDEFEGSDSCIEITNISNFYNDLTNTINTLSPVIFRGIHEVIYQDREEAWNGLDWGHHPALIKEELYRPQGELRAIWQPRFNQPIRPMIVGNYRLGASVSFVDI